jgi:hypothetical protein
MCDEVYFHLTATSDIRANADSLTKEYSTASTPSWRLFSSYALRKSFKSFINNILQRGTGFA